MKKLTKEDIKEISKKLKNKFSDEIEYLGYNRFALIESHRKAIESEKGKIRRYKLAGYT